MSEETMLTIKAKLDAKGLDDLVAYAERSLDSISRDVDAFNKSTRVAPDTKEFKKKIEEASKLLEELTAKREIVIAKPKTDAVRKELDKLDGYISKVTRTREMLIEIDERELAKTEDEISRVEERLDSLEEKREVPVEVNVDADNVEEAVESTEELNKELDEVEEKRRVDIDSSDLDGAALDAVSDLTDSLDGVAKSATKVMANVVGVSEKTASGVAKVIQSLSGMSTLIAGPLALALTGAVTALGTYVISSSDAENTTKQYEKSLEDLRKKYDELALSTKNAEDKTREFFEQQERAIKAQTIKIRGEIEEFNKQIAEAVSFKQISTDDYAETFYGIDTTIKMATESGRKFQEEIIRIAEEQRKGNITAEAAAKEIEILATNLDNLEGKDGGIPKRSNDMAVLRGRIAELLPLYDQLAERQKRLADITPFDQFSQKINETFKRTIEGQRETLKSAVADAEKAWQAMLDPEFYAGKTSEEIARLQQQAEAVKRQAEKNLADFEKRQAGSRKESKKADEDQIEVLNKRYAAQQEISAKIIADQTDLSNTLADIEKAYYAELERLTRQNYEKQIAQGKALTDAQIAELQRIIEKNKELATQGDSLQLLEETYNTRVSIAKKTVNEEEKLEKELLDLRKQFLQQKLNLLIQEAETAMQLRGEIKEDTLAAIREVKAELDTIGGEDNNMAQKVSQQVQQWGNYLNSIASNLGDFMNAQYDARINSLDKALERELRMLETAHEKEMTMYEEQLEQYANLEEEKEKLTEEHNERLEELNWKAQEHITEDEYRAIMDQRAQEEEKYNESMMRLEEDTLARDEIRLQQEIAEQEYLARKEQLEKEYAIRRAQMERKQAESQKTQALFNAFVMMSVAIARAWADHMFPYSAVVAGIAQTAGMIQIAAIAARPLPSIPSYHIGGIIGGPNIQDYGHLPGPDNPHDKTLFWGQEGEYVLPLAESQAYQFLRAHGHNLTGLVDRVLMRSNAPVPSAAVVAPVTHNTQQVTYQVKNELTFSEARRLQAKANRAFLRSLA